MPINILMPALSPTMEKGNLAKWLKKEGDPVKAGDIIAEIETDKATMEVEAADEGVLAKIVVPEGTADVPVNQLIAVLAGEGEDVKAAAAGAKSAAPPPAPAAPKPPQAAEAPPKPSSAPAPSPQPSPQRGEGASAAPPPPSFTSPRGGEVGTRSVPGEGGRTDAGRMDGGRIFSSPLARRLAREAGIDLGRVQGTGPHGRVVARDIEAAKSGTGLRAPGLAAPEEINATAPKHDGKPAYKISVNDFIIKALALALQKVPEANVTWTEGAMLKHKHSDVGVAVAIKGGLITPVVRKAEQKSLSAISNEMKDFAARARARKLMPEEYQGGSTAVSNLGMYGIKDFYAVINPPHATILSVGAGEARPVVRNGNIEIAQVMTVGLSTDHRAVDGALGAELLGAFRQFIENPVMMLV